MRHPTHRGCGYQQLLVDKRGWRATGYNREQFMHALILQLASRGAEAAAVGVVEDTSAGIRAARALRHAALASPDWATRRCWS